VKVFKLRLFVYIGQAANASPQRPSVLSTLATINTTKIVFSAAQYG